MVSARLHDSCVTSLHKSGKITDEVRDQLLSGDVDTPQKALEMVDYMVAGVMQGKRETALAAKAFDTAMKQAESHPNGMAAGIMALLDKDHAAPYLSVEKLGQIYRNRYHAMVSDALEMLHPRLSLNPKTGFTKTNRETMELFVRALFGETIEDKEIAKAAKSFKEMYERQRKDFNSAGGSIPKNERWNGPQTHDMRRFKNTEEARTQWKEYIYDRLDWDNMTDDLGRAIPEESRDEVLDYVYDTIRTGGINKVSDTAKRPPKGVSRKLSRRHSEQRFLYFKDATAWMEYQDAFGTGDAYSVLVSHMDAMAHDVALMERLGPNPEATLQGLMFQAKKAEQMPQVWESAIDSVWGVVSGAANHPAITWLADIAQATRNWLSASMLPAAFLSAVSDEAFKIITNAYNGLPILGTLRTEMALMSNKEMRKFAVELGLGADVFTQMATTGNRYADVHGAGFTARLTDSVLRASFLTGYTDAGRKAFGMEYSKNLAKFFDTEFDSLPGKMADIMNRYGIDANDWDVFRSREPMEFGGVKFADIKEDEKFANMIMIEMDFAVPTPGAKERAVVTGGLQKGTLWGEIARNVGMFKSFPVTLVNTHMLRGIKQSTWGGRADYLAKLLFTTGAFGYISLNAKDIAAGREPRDIDDTGDLAKLGLASIIQGGGAGILGDFIYSDVNRFGSGFTSTVSSPVTPFIDGLARVTLGNIQEAIDPDEDTSVGETVGEALQFAKRYTPSLWQIDFVKDALFDYASKQVDPQQEDRFYRMMRKREREFNQEYWLEPGSLGD